MTTDTLETAALKLYEGPVLSLDQLQKYRQTIPLVSVAGLCYASPEYSQQLLQEGLPYREGFHLTLVEEINTAMRSAARNDYDFILMVGPQQSQLEDILMIAKAQFFSSKRSPIYVLGKMHQKTSGLLKILGPSYSLMEIPTINDLHELLESRRD